MLRTLLASAVLCWSARLATACPCCPTCTMMTCPCACPTCGVMPTAAPSTLAPFTSPQPPTPEPPTPPPVTTTLPPTTTYPPPALCDVFSCPAGTVMRGSAASITGSTVEACCLQTCAGFSCPSGTVKRDGAEDITGESKEACCLDVCSAFTCPSGTKLREAAASIPGSDESGCCEELKCDVFTCPEGQILRSGAENIKGNDASACCEFPPVPPKLCSGFSCPDSMVLRENAASIEGDDAAACCLQTCTAFTCPEGMVIRDGADKITVTAGEAATCCLKTCAGFTCPAGKTIRDGADSITGEDEATCCVQTCGGFTCPSGSVLQANAGSVTGNDEATCCLKTCSGFTCPAGKTLRENAAEFTGHDEATCCSQTCSGFECPAGKLVREDAASVTGSDEATCCVQTCSGFSCPAGQKPKDGAEGILGSDAATCCEETGPLLECSVNCYGDSATAVPLPGGSGNGIPADDIDKCREACVGTADCEGIVFGEGMCYAKKDIEVTKCQPSDGSFTTEFLKRMPFGTCIVMGDPHVLTFDNPTGQIGDNTQLTAGDYVVVESESLTIHGRFGYSDRFPGEASLTGLSISGSLTMNQKLVVEYKGPDKGESGFHTSWNGAEILTAMGSSYTSDDGKLIAKKDNMNPDDFHNQARHTIGGDTGSGDRPSFLFQITPDVTLYILMGDQTMNAVVTMRKLSGGQDGYCGNFNCLAEDDTLDELGKRGRAAPLASSSFPSPPRAGSMTKAEGAAPKTLNDCDPALLQKAEESCKGADAAMKEDCMFDICASGSTEAGTEDLMTDSIGEDMEKEMEEKFSFMGLSLPALAIAGISPALQWFLVFSTVTLAAVGFAGGVYSRRFRRSTAARAGGFSRVAEDEEEALLVSSEAWEHNPSYHHDSELSELDA